MKKLIVFLATLAFYILSSSFTIVEENKSSLQKSTSSDSMVVNVKFDNPKVVVSDERSVAYLNKLIETHSQSIDNIANAIKETNSYLPFLVESQERRYENESAKDRLVRWCEGNPLIVEKYINKTRLKGIISSVVLMTYTLLCFFTILIKVDYRTVDWRVITTQGIFLCIFGIILFILVKELYPLLMSKELYQFQFYLWHW